MRRLHLPDCESLRPYRYMRGCDCGMPPGILPTNRTLVHRFSRKRGRVALVIVAKSQVREDEEDLCKSQLSDAVETRSLVRREQQRSDRKSRRKDAWSVT